MSNTAPIRLIAHRGASAECPENTRCAVQRALEIGVDAVECDVQLTKDGVPLVVHDAQLARLCKSPWWVREQPAAELIGMPVSTPDTAGEPAELWTLEEWLAALPDSVLPVIELKPQAGASNNLELADATLAVLGPNVERAALISFSPVILERLQEKGCKATQGPIQSLGLEDATLATLQAAARPVVVLEKALLVPRTLAPLQEGGCEIWSYPLDTEAEAKEALDLGVTGIISNDPARVLKTVRG